MALFASPFFSKAGQVERLRNVGSTLKASLTGKGVVANTGNATANKVIGAAASNPYVTALGGAVAYAPKAAIGAASAGFSSLSTTGKVATVVAAPIAVSAIISNPKIATSVAKTPSGLANLGGNIAEFAENPSLEGAKGVFLENPVLASGALLGAGLAVGSGVTGLVATGLNTRAIRENTQATLASPAESIDSPATFIPSSSAGGASSMIPYTQETQVIGRETRTGVSRRRKARKAVDGQKVNVKILNQNTYIGGRR